MLIGVAGLWGQRAAAETDTHCSVRGFLTMSISFEAQGPALLATVKTTHDQVLPDGNTIHLEMDSRVARDGKGRNYVEGILRCQPGPDGTLIKRYGVAVRDPEGKSNLTWETGAGAPQFANLFHRQPSVSPPVGTTKPAALPPGPQAKTISLGPQTIAGYTAAGKRFVRTTPAGAEGNARDLRQVEESWRSSDLGMTLKTVFVDLRSGQTMSEVTAITLGEPDPALFAPPDKYVVKDATSEYPLK